MSGDNNEDDKQSSEGNGGPSGINNKVSNETKGKVRNTMLLSFGDEMEEEDEFSVVLKGKGKSAHDLLDDEKLSKETAIDTSKFGGQSGSSTTTTTGFRKKKTKKENVPERFDDEEEDLQKLVDESKARENEEKLKNLKDEIRKMQKEYKKSLRQLLPEEEEVKSETVKEYYNTKLKFKDKTKNIHKLKDPRREEQTMEMLSQFRNKLHELSTKKVMSERRCGDEVKKVEEEKKEEPKPMEEENKEERIQMPNLDWEAEDLPDEEWMVHKFVAPAPDPNVTRAKDANLKDESEDWYDLSDPRNKINVRKRMKLDNEE
uniref:Peptidyl-prolyl cis-trans isomerase CWC27 homolog (inferred by orthology to a human protein) n=1 Tax=Strongyloides venezuelensis TaxID=75913 RepID=A0A0K0FGT6_STRVS